MKSILLAAVAAMGIGGAAEAVTTPIDLRGTYGSKSDDYWFSFYASDDNRDGRLEQYEVTSVVGSYLLEPEESGFSIPITLGGGDVFILELEANIADGFGEAWAMFPYRVRPPQDWGEAWLGGRVDIAPVPLPAGAALLPFALLGFGVLRRRKNRQAIT